MIKKITEELHKYASKEKAKILMSFFKTGKGQYGEGDVFIGVSMPEIRALSKKYYQLVSITQATKLLKSEIHDQRMLALVMLVNKYKQGSEAERLKIFNVFLKKIQYINNWDLVDVTVPHVIGDWLIDKKRRRII